MAGDEISVVAALGIYTASPDFLLQVLIEELKMGQMSISVRCVKGGSGRSAEIG